MNEALSMMEHTTVDPTNAQIRSAFADAYADLGHAQIVIASARGSVPSQQERWRAARDLSRRSLAIWNDLRDRGILSALDRPKFDAVARQVARCERMLDPATETARR